MSDLLAARLQMAVSLGFHIVFACIGMAMPLLMAIAEYRWLKTGQTVYRDLARAWSKGVAIFFAVGAVSGTVLSFELGLLWPGFMEHAGAIIGMPFSWEGTAFFIEAIAIGLFLYGWDRLGRWAHWWTGVTVCVAGVVSGIFVVAANGWMNSPSGFDWVDGRAVNIDPVAAMFNDAWFSQALHMTIAAFAATGFAVAGLHALLLLKNPRNLFHVRAVQIALVTGAVAALLQPLSGDISARFVAETQPAKLAAMEALFHTSRPAPLIIGGIPDEEREKVDYALHIPGALSFLAHGDFEAEVTGLDAFAPEDRPPVAITHYAFQIMVAIGMVLAVVGILFFLARWKWKHWQEQRWYLWMLVLAGPLGFIAVEAGWTVTEVGRQPWIIQGIMRTKDAVSSMPGLQYPFFFVTGIYLVLTFVLVWLMRRQIATVPDRFASARETLSPEQL